MVTQPNTQLEARPAVPDVQHRLPLHLPGLAHLRPVPQSTRATGTRPLNGALVGLQLLIGYEWLLAGGDKFLLGTFPAQLRIVSVEGLRLHVQPVVVRPSNSSPR